MARPERGLWAAGATDAREGHGIPPARRRFLQPKRRALSSGKDNIQDPTSNIQRRSMLQVLTAKPLPTECATRLLSFGAWIWVPFWMLDVDCWTLSLVSLRSLRSSYSRGRVAYLGDMQFSASLLRLVSKPMNHCNKSLMQRADLFAFEQFSEAGSRTKKPALLGLFILVEVLLSQVGEHPRRSCLDSIRFRIK